MKTLMTIALSGALSAGCVAEPAPAPGDGGAFDELIARHRNAGNRLPNNVPIGNASGISTTVSSRGYIDLNNEFFRDLGSNGRRCVSCHLPTAGWSVTPAQLRAVFEATRGGVIDDGLGLGAVFRTNDGSNSPLADVSTLARRRAAYSMLLTRGLIRIGLPI